MIALEGMKESIVILEKELQAAKRKVLALQVDNDNKQSKI